MNLNPARVSKILHRDYTDDFSNNLDGMDHEKEPQNSQDS